MSVNIKACPTYLYLFLLLSERYVMVLSIFLIPEDCQQTKICWSFKQVTDVFVQSVP
jgi:hypothetical protein